MADYKAIKGESIQTVSSDLSNPILGQVWYNSTLGKVRVAKTQVGAWATSNNMATARGESSGAGTSTAGIAMGGAILSGPTSALCETYDGSSWTEVADLNTARDGGMSNIGTQTATLLGGGGPAAGRKDEVEQWNGSSWTEIADINTGRWAGGGSGTTTAAIIFGGGAPSESPNQVAYNEEWNGTSWTEITDMSRPAGKTWFGAAGDTSTAAIAFGGAPGNHDKSETWDGSSWTEGDNLNTGRRYPDGFGSSEACIGASGYVTNDVVKNTEEYNGTSWTEVADLTTVGRFNSYSFGTTSAGVLAGGGGPPGTWSILANTEEWTGETVVAANVTAS